MSKTPKKRTKLTSRVLQLEVDRFISNRTNSIIGEKAQKGGTINQNGFVEVLNGGMKSTDHESLEVIMPSQVDFSIKQNNGFSLFFWLYLTKPSSSKIPVNVFKKGDTVDQFTPTISLTDNQQRLFVEFSTSKSKSEIVFSNKKLEINHFYSIAINFSINYEDELTEVSLYLDGKLDTQTTIQGEPIHNQGNFFFGKASTTHGFKGTVADVAMFPSCLSEYNIAYAHDEGLRSLLESKGTDFHMRDIFTEIFKRQKLIKKYAMYTGKPVYAVENLNLSNESMLEVVKNYDEEEVKNDIRPLPEEPNERIERLKMERMVEYMGRFIDNEDNRIFCEKINENGRFINTIFFLANRGEDNLEIERIVKIFEVIKEVLLFTVDYQFIKDLADILMALLESKEDKKEYVKVKTFFINLQTVLSTIQENRIREEEENAKYASNRKKGKPNIKSLYKTKTKPNQYEEIPMQNIQPFGNCIPEHEILLLNTQNMKNIIDIEQEKNLQNYQSSFVIKSLYEKPKNLPGENPNSPVVKILSTSTSYVTTEKEEEEIDSDKNKIDQNVINDVNGFIDELLLDLEPYENSIEPRAIKNDQQAEIEEKKILERRRRIQEEKEKKEHENNADDSNKPKEQVDPNAKNEQKKYSFDPKYPKNWNQGQIEVVINHCYNCNKHRNTTKHWEYQFIDKFNEVGAAIIELFPKAIIIGNLDPMENFGLFDVYLRGIGLPTDDYMERYFIYKKSEVLKFPTTNDITDKLVALSILFGSSLNIQSAQAKVIRNDEKLPQTHSYPYELPDANAKAIEEIKNKENEEREKRKRMREKRMNELKA